MEAAMGAEAAEAEVEARAGDVLAAAERVVVMVAVAEAGVADLRAGAAKVVARAEAAWAEAAASRRAGRAAATGAGSVPCRADRVAAEAAAWGRGARGRGRTFFLSRVSLTLSLGRHSSQENDYLPLKTRPLSTKVYTLAVNKKNMRVSTVHMRNNCHTGTGIHTPVTTGFCVLSANLKIKYYYAVIGAIYI